MKTAKEMRALTDSVTCERETKTKEKHIKFIEERAMPAIEAAAKDGRDVTVIYPDAWCNTKMLAEMLASFGYTTEYDGRLFIRW